MRKITTSLKAITFFIITSSFTTKDLILLKQCDYNMYNSIGTYLGSWSMNIPDNVSCGSKAAKALAIADYNVWN